MPITKKNGKVELRSYETGKKLGEFDEVKDARKRLKQIELRKKLRSRKK